MGILEFKMGKTKQNSSDPLMKIFEDLKKHENSSPTFKYPRNLYNDRKFSFVLKIWNKIVERILRKYV
jgi:hypothetical protein